MPRLYDMHVHLYQFPAREIEDILGSDPSLILVAVSDDAESAMKTLELAEVYDGRVIPCVGYHPWNLKEGGSISESRESLRIAYKAGVKCIGEVGLDRKFLPEDTWPVQLEIFREWVKAAAELDAMVNIHSPGAWQQALEEARRLGAPRAMFHWYTGPVHLIREIRGSGYYISINPAVKIQKKHQAVVEAAGLDDIVFESDGPYNYRGLRLNPLMIKDTTLDIVSGVKGVSRDEVAARVEANSRLLLGL